MLRGAQNLHALADLDTDHFAHHDPAVS